MTRKVENRLMIAEALAAHKPKLSAEHFEKLVDEINDVNLRYVERKASLPSVAAGTLDGNAAEIRALEREEAANWIIIKQKYGV